jgi:hypothetical protein
LLRKPARAEFAATRIVSETEKKIARIRFALCFVKTLTTQIKRTDSSDANSILRQVPLEFRPETATAVA